MGPFHTLLGLYSVAALYDDKSYTTEVNHIYAQSPTTFQFTESTSLNECETWNAENNSVPIHNLYGGNEKNTSCLDATWDSVEADGYQVTLDLNTLPRVGNALLSREEEVELLVHNKANAPSKTMFVTSDQAITAFSDRVFAKITEVDAAGAIQKVEVFHAGASITQTSNVEIKFWGQGTPADIDEHSASGAVLKFTWKDVTPDGKGTVAGVTVVKGGKGYQKTDAVFNPDSWIQSGKLAHQDIEGTCKWVDTDGKTATDFKALGITEYSETDCKFGENAQKKSKHCDCRYFATRYGAVNGITTAAEEPCNLIPFGLKSFFNGVPLTFFAYTFISEIEGMLPEGVTKQVHLPLGENIKLAMNPKWKKDDRNYRNKLTVKVTNQDDSNPLCDYDLINALDNYQADYSCEQSKSKLEIDAVGLLNQKAKAVTQEPFAWGYRPSTRLSIDESTLPTVQFKNAQKSGASCSITRRPSNNQAVLTGIRVIHGGECTAAPMVQIRQSKTTGWMNVSLTLEDNKITAATIPSASDFPSDAVLSECKDGARNGDETDVDEGGRCDYFRVDVPTQIDTYGDHWRLMDAVTITAIEMSKRGINFNTKKDSNGDYEDGDVEATITYPADTIISDHAAVKIEIDDDRSVSVTLDDAGQFWQDVTAMDDNHVTITQKAGGPTSDHDSRSRREFKVLPITERNCKVMPQFEFIFEDAHNDVDATCEYIWEEAGCDSDGSKNWTLKGIDITQGTGYVKYDYKDSTNDEVTKYPYIDLPPTKAADNWFNEHVYFNVEASEQAQIEFGINEGIVSAEVTSGGKGYYVDDAKITYPYFNIGMPVNKPVQKLSENDLYTGTAMVRNVVVIESGEGYDSTFQQICCSKFETSTAEGKIISHVLSGEKIGEITVDDKGAVKTATLHPRAWQTCQSEFSDDFHFYVCGARITSVSFKDSPESCTVGAYDTVPIIEFDEDSDLACDYLTFSASNTHCKRPVIEGVLDGSGLTSFTVKDGGWFPEAQVSTGKSQLEIDDILYDWGGELLEPCADPADTSCVKSKRLSESSHTFAVNWETPGKGAYLELDYALSTLNEVRGKSITQDGTTYKKGGTKLKYTTFSFDGAGALSALSLNRKAYHVFDIEDAPLTLEIVPRYYTGAAPTWTSPILKSNFNADGTLTVKHELSDFDHGEFKTFHSTLANTNTLKVTAQTLDNQINHQRPKAHKVTIKNEDDVKIVDEAWGSLTLSFGALGHPVSVNGVNDYDDYYDAGDGTNQHAEVTKKLAQVTYLGRDENNTQTWEYSKLPVHQLRITFSSPNGAGVPYYPNDDKLSPKSDMVPFESESGLFNIFFSGNVSYEVEDIPDFTDSSANVTVYKPNTDMDHKEGRLRVCPKHSLYQSIHFTTEVLEGDKFVSGEGKVNVYFGDAIDATSDLSTLYVPYDDDKFPTTRESSKYIFTRSSSSSAPVGAVRSDCVDVKVVYAEGMCADDTTAESLTVKITSKVTYKEGECIIDDDCIDRTNGGGATKASLAVRESANSDIDRFSYCFIAENVHAGTCRECLYDIDCDGGQYCFDASYVFQDIDKYHTPEMKAWAQKTINKHGTCQKKQGLGKTCGTGYKVNKDGANKFLSVKLDERYVEMYTKNGDGSTCGEYYTDFDGHVYRSSNADNNHAWLGFCESHVCVECTKHVHSSGIEDYEHSGKVCVAGQLVNAKDTGITTKNDYWDQAQKLSNANEAATKVAETKLTMLTDIMGVTLMFAILTSVSTVLTTMLLMGRCNGCKSQGNSKVAPE
jgi:hypothetical protein